MLIVVFLLIYTFYSAAHETAEAGTGVIADSTITPLEKWAFAVFSFYGSDTMRALILAFCGFTYYLLLRFNVVDGIGNGWGKKGTSKQTCLWKNKFYACLRKGDNGLDEWYRILCLWTWDLISSVDGWVKGVCWIIRLAVLYLSIQNKKNKKTCYSP